MAAGMFDAGDQVLVDLRDWVGRPEGVRDEEPATVVSVDAPSGVATVQLTGLASGTPIIGDMPGSRLSHLDPIGEVEALGWTIEDVQDDPQTSHDQVRLYTAVVRNDGGGEVARREVYSARKLLEAVAQAELFPDERLKAWRKREAWLERNPPEP